MMSRIAALLLRVGALACIIAGILDAQPSNGYVFFAPGGVTCCGHSTAMTVQMGVGGEAVLGKGVGVGAELSALATRQYFSDSVVGMFSPNGYYHFSHRKEVKLDPFVTGGYTLMFRSGHVNLFNFGGGTTWWFHHRLGARLELRDQVYRNGGTLHYWGFRFGLAFR